MNYGTIKKTDIANGPGVRVSLFVSGCRNHCKGCFNPETWSFDYGHRFSQATISRILSALSPDYISGLSILGGDPLEPENRPHVANLIRAVRREYGSSKTVWIWSGYRFEKVKKYAAVRWADVLVDGPFIEDLKDISLTFRGSSNQRIIDLPQSRRKGEIILYTKGIRK